MTITGPPDTGLTNAEANDVHFALGRTVTFAGSGTVGGASFTPQAAVQIDAPTYAFGMAAGQTIATASTVTIQGPPSAGTNATLTNSYGLYVPTASLTTSVTNAYGLRVDAPSGASANGAAEFTGITYLNGNVGIFDSAPANPLSIESGMFSVSTAGKVTNYNGVATAAGGVPATLVAMPTGLQTVSYPPTTLLTATVGALYYRINYYLFQTFTGTGCAMPFATVTPVFNWTDVAGSGTPRQSNIGALTLPNSTMTSSYISGSIPIIARGSSTITFSATLLPGSGGCTAPPSYDMYVWVEAM